MTEITAPTHEAPTATDDTAAIGARNRLVITLLLISTFVMILNETLMSVALPNLMEAFSIEASAAQWLTTAFLLTMAVVIPITGWLLQRVHTRSIYIAAMSLFTAGTVIAAAAPSFELLLAGRIVQASGTAIMIPLLFTTVLTLVPAAHRGRIMGNISIVISVAPALGPVISGAVLHFLEWRWLFLLVLPIAVASLILGAMRVPNVTEPSVTKLDVFSVILSAFGFGGLVFGLSNIGSLGIASMASWMPLAVGVVALTIFILRQVRLQKTDTALLDLRTFQSKNFTFAIALMMISMISLFGTIVLIPLFSVEVLGLDEFQTGLMLLPGGLIMGLLAPFVGRLYDRIGPRVLLVAGAIIVNAALWGMTMLTEGIAFGWVVGAHITLSIGLALLFTPLFTAGLGSIKPKLYSHGSAIVSTIQQLAGAAGVALFITVMTATVTRELGNDATEVAATAAGIHTAFIFGAIISLVAIPLAFFVRKPAAQESDGAGAPPVH